LLAGKFAKEAMSNRDQRSTFIILVCGEDSWDQTQVVGSGPKKK